MITTDDAKVEAAEQQQQQTQQDQIDLSKELSDRIIDAASTGGKDGFEIKMGRKTGRKIRDPLSPDGKEEDEVVFDTSKTYHRHSISTQDYKRYNQAKEQLANETDENKRNDLAMRMYEYLALKFLGMTHDEFVQADFDDVVVAALACDAMFGIGNSPQQQQRTERRLPNPRMTLSASGSKQPRNYYQAPDEE